jgi:hypothetical protein
MSKADRFGWDFDRRSTQRMEGFETFSVGIFQWMTKASRKDLKKSGAVTRVLGYTAEPDLVYKKAIEICARLNRESASADNPPMWLQKQYSVPAPAGMVIDRVSNEFTSAQVRAARLKIAKEYLLPAGFVTGKDATYIRQLEDQVHLINFQGSMYGHKFTVNVGFHYDFIPPIFHQKIQPISDFGLLDCIVSSRIGLFMDAKRDTWFEYGEEHALLRENLRLCATTCLTLFNGLAERWRDPSIFLADASIDPSINCWHVPEKLSLGWVELRAGNVAAAETRLANWSDDRYRSPPPRYLWLRERVEEYRKLETLGVAQTNWKSWISDCQNS